MRSVRIIFSTAVFSAIALTISACVSAPPVSQSSLPQPATEESSTPDDPVESVEQTIGDETLLPVEAPPFSTESWATDFNRRTVAWSDILSGGPPKDGIPAIDDPSFESVAGAGEWLSDNDPIIVFENKGEVRGYPLSILIWHEIVNDTVGDKPVAVTFCPLCNASIVFERVLDGQVLDFGTTGKLRNSDLIMYDRQSETWWQQFTGEAIVGEHSGRQLDFLSSQVISFADFAAEFPEGEVLARPPVSRSYGNNPYVGYDSGTDRPFLFSGKLDDRLNPTERVVGLNLDDVKMAYPFESAATAGAINDELGDLPIVVMHKPGTASALDGREIAGSRDVGSVGVFDRRVGDQMLTFTATDDGAFIDAETGTTWNILGEAVEGSLAGSSLEQILAFDHFWFAWAAFFPETDLYEE